MTGLKKTIVHGSAVAFRDRGNSFSAILLRGISGSGKSDLAFRLIGAGGILISDDQTALEQQQEKIMTSAPAAISGLLEVRGLGLLKYPVTAETELRLVIDLTPRGDVPRLPDWKTTDILGITLPCLNLHAFDTSTPLKIIKAIELVHKPELLVR